MSQEEYLRDLEERVKFAEKCMASAYSIPVTNDISHFKNEELKKYRERYPVALVEEKKGNV